MAAGADIYFSSHDIFRGANFEQAREAAFASMRHMADGECRLVHLIINPIRQGIDLEEDIQDLNLGEAQPPSDRFSVARKVENCLKVMQFFDPVQPEMLGAEPKKYFTLENRSLVLKHFYGFTGNANDGQTSTVATIENIDQIFKKEDVDDDLAHKIERFVVENEEAGWYRVHTYMFSRHGQPQPMGEAPPVAIAPAAPGHQPRAPLFGGGEGNNFPPPRSLFG